MTRKHFIQIADNLVKAFNAPDCKLDKAGRAYVIKGYASVCKACNPRFDQTRFTDYIEERVVR